MEIVDTNLINTFQDDPKISDIDRGVFVYAYTTSLEKYCGKRMGDIKNVDYLPVQELAADIYNIGSHACDFAYDYQEVRNILPQFIYLYERSGASMCSDHAERKMLIFDLLVEITANMLGAGRLHLVCSTNQQQCISLNREEIDKQKQVIVDSNLQQGVVSSSSYSLPKTKIELK